MCVCECVGIYEATKCKADVWDGQCKICHSMLDECNLACIVGGCIVDGCMRSCISNQKTGHQACNLKVTVHSWCWNQGVNTDSGC